MKFVLLFALSLVLCIQSHAENSVLLPIPATIADSLPWFAVRETQDANTPFTKARLQTLAATQNRVALVYFATWCIPCRVGIKRLAASQRELEEHKVQIVLVNIDEQDFDKVNKWVSNVQASDFITVVDAFKVTTERFGIIKEGESIALPMTLVVDEKAKPVKLVGREGDDWPSILWK